MLSYRKINVLFLAFVLLLLFLCFFTTIRWWYFLLLLGLRFVVLVIGSSFIQLNFHVKAYCENPNEKQRKIALTFDDGPTEFTPQILALLDQYSAKATFFCIGKNVEKHPETVKRTFENGYIIANHSYSHSHFFDFFGRRKVTQELQKTDGLIQDIIGKRPRFFRPPYGVTNPAIARALKVTGHHVIGWNIRSMDGVSNDESKIYNRIVRQIQPGAVVLLHDTSGASVRVLEQLLLFLQANNYTVVPLDGLLNLKAYED